MNNNDSLREKAIKVNELENVSGGYGRDGKYAWVNHKTCVGCEPKICMDACPRIYAQTYYKDDDGLIKPSIKGNMCNGCGNCITKCKHNAIKWCTSLV